MTVISYALVAPTVAVSAGQDPVEVAGVAGQLRRLVDHVTSAVQSVTAHQQSAAEEIRSEGDPQTWLFVQRARYLAEGHCDPYAEQMLRRMGLLPH